MLGDIGSGPQRRLIEATTMYLEAVSQEVILANQGTVQDIESYVAVHNFQRFP